MEFGENFTADRVKRNRCEDPFSFRGRVVLNLTSLFSLVGKRGCKEFRVFILMTSTLFRPAGDDSYRSAYTAMEVRSLFI